MSGDGAESAVAVRLRVVRAILSGLLAEVLTIVTVVVAIYGRQLVAALPPQELPQYGQRAAAVVGPTFGVVYTFLMALWVVRRVHGRYVSHALLVAAGAVALHTLGSFGAPGGYQAIYLVADACKVVAALGAALLGGRRSTSAAVA
jgi:hypothetical protein